MDDDRAQIAEAAQALATAIERRDEAAIRNLLAPDFLLRSPGKPAADLAAFIEGIRGIPAEIVFVRLEHVEIDIAGASALATGVQHARVRVDGETLDERRPFVDWFVRTPSGRWLLQVALDLGQASLP